MEVVHISHLCCTFKILLLCCQRSKSNWQQSVCILFFTHLWCSSLWCRLCTRWELARDEETNNEEILKDDDGVIPVWYYIQQAKKSSAAVFCWPPNPLHFSREKRKENSNEWDLERLVQRKEMMHSSTKVELPTLGWLEYFRPSCILRVFCNFIFGFVYLTWTNFRQLSPLKLRKLCFLDPSGLGRSIWKICWFCINIIIYREWYCAKKSSHPNQRHREHFHFKSEWTWL